jgi:hypothetical protein
MDLLARAGTGRRHTRSVLLPSHLRPISLGLQWGMSRDACLRVLGVPAEEGADHAGRVSLVLGGEAVEVALELDDHEELRRISTQLRVSRDFFEPAEGYHEEVARVEAEYRAYYGVLRERYAAALGAPAFAGTWTDNGFPEDEEWVALLTCWEFPESRVCLAYDHPDQELPVTVTLHAVTR